MQYAIKMYLQKIHENILYIDYVMVILIMAIFLLQVYYFFLIIFPTINYKHNTYKMYAFSTHRTKHRMRFIILYFNHLFLDIFILI